jgi:hypothetical protein
LKKNSWTTVTQSKWGQKKINWHLKRVICMSALVEMGYLFNLFVLMPYFISSIVYSEAQKMTNSSEVSGIKHKAVSKWSTIVKKMI